MGITRRQVIVTALAGGALAVGYVLRPRKYPLPLTAGRDETVFDAWIRVAKDGVVTVAVPQLEMGQGISTLLAQIVAVEMGADWNLVGVQPVPPSALYANLPLAARWAELWMPAAPALAGPDAIVTRRWAEAHRFDATADGLSLAAYEEPARAAAASVRALLCMAAADRWGIDWQECTASRGYVRHGSKSLRFGALAEEAAGFDAPDPPPLRERPAQERPLVAATLTPIDGPEQSVPEAVTTPPAYPRIDLPAKVDGSLLFAGDVRLPGMVHAAIRHGPIGDSTLASADHSKAKGVSGLISFVRGKRWLAAVASDWWAAERALTLIAPNFSTARRADSARIDAALDEALTNGSATSLFTAGDAEGLTHKPYALALRYDFAAALHATLETASATARITGGKLELWVASQAPELTRRAAAEAAGIDERNAVLYPMPAGGSFDRRLEHDHAVEAAIIAREVGRPVQLTWSRWQEHLAGPPRTPVTAVMAAKTTANGEITGWKARLAMPASTLEFGRRVLGGETRREAIEGAAGRFDAMAMEGAVPPYAIEDMVIEHVPAKIDLPTGRLRGNAHGYTAFLNETFVDELAHRAGREPLSYRVAMLGHEPRLVDCLQRVASLANWGGGGDASGQGLACHVMTVGGVTGRIAVIATARRDTNGVKVDRLSAVADLGRIVNLDIARQQIEGGLVFGLGLALGSSMAYVDGLPANGRLGALGLPLLGDCPAIEVSFLDGNGPPFDPGELGVAAVGPAVANALFSATGVRFRRLPLISEEL